MALAPADRKSTKIDRLFESFFSWVWVKMNSLETWARYFDDEFADSAMKCYRCGQSGHKAHDCTNEAKVRCPQSPAALAPPTPRSPPLPRSSACCRPRSGADPSLVRPHTAAPPIYIRHPRPWRGAQLMAAPKIASLRPQKLLAGEVPTHTITEPLARATAVGVRRILQVALLQP